jgi:hypothetical protein
MGVDAQRGVYCDGGALQNGTHLNDPAGVPTKTKQSTWLFLSALVDQRRAISVCRASLPGVVLPGPGQPGKARLGGQRRQDVQYHSQQDPADTSPHPVTRDVVSHFSTSFIAVPVAASRLSWQLQCRARPEPPRSRRLSSGYTNLDVSIIPGSPRKIYEQTVRFCVSFVRETIDPVGGGAETAWNYMTGCTSGN